MLLVTALGCDAGSGVEEPPPGPDLDETLIGLITRQGQRGLGALIQPESTDLARIPQDPANPLTPEKVALGQMLFHETALGTEPSFPSATGTYGCVSCHHEGAGFQAGRLQAIGDAGTGWGRNGEGRRPAQQERPDVQPIRTPSILNGAFQDVMHWDGSLGATGQNTGTDAHWTGTSAINALGYDGLETQAIAALSVHRMGALSGSVLETNATYQRLWDESFPGEAVSRERAGLAIAAWERTVFASRAPFQEWLRGNRMAMTAQEKRGAILFFGDAGCESCHTGPALSGPGFYALGMPDMGGPDALGPLPPSRGRGGFLEDPAHQAQFKVPQLYNLADSPFYGHGGSFRTLRDVVNYYNEAVPAVPIPPGLLEVRFVPLELSEEEVDDLTAFLESALRDPDLSRYAPSALPSGNCFPVNDPQGRRDLGCD